MKLTLGGLHTFSADVSPRGFAAELMQPLRPGQELHGSIEVNGTLFPFTGKVCWARAGEPRINLRARFGVRFTDISKSFDALFQATYLPNAVT